jgi:hypothetical protein
MGLQRYYYFKDGFNRTPYTYTVTLPTQYHPPTPPADSHTGLETDTLGCF